MIVNPKPLSFRYSLLLSLVIHFCVLIFWGLSLPKSKPLKKMEFVVSLQSNDSPKVNVRQVTEVPPVVQPKEPVKKNKKKDADSVKPSFIKKVEKSKEQATQASTDVKQEDASVSNQITTNSVSQQAVTNEKNTQTQSSVKVDKKIKDDYGDILGRHIAKFKYYPKYAEMHRIQGHVILELVFDEAGQLVSTQISRSSGDSMLDAAARNMVKSAMPLPLPIGSLKGKAFSMFVPIEFLLN